MLKKRFYGFGLIKITLLFFIFNLIIGFLFGLVFLILLKMSFLALEIKNIPLLSLNLLSFILIPLGFAFVGATLCFLFFLVLNLILRIIKGVDIYFNEEKLNENEPI